MFSSFQILLISCWNVSKFGDMMFSTVVYFGFMRFEACLLCRTLDSTTCHDYKSTKFEFYA